MKRGNDCAFGSPYGCSGCDSSSRPPPGGPYAGRKQVSNLVLSSGLWSVGPSPTVYNSSWGVLSVFASYTTLSTSRIRETRATRCREMQNPQGPSGQ